MPGIAHHTTHHEVEQKAQPKPASPLLLSIFPVVTVQMLPIVIPPGKLLQLPRPRRFGQCC